MPYKEKQIEKKYFSIGEVAEMIDVAPSLIRFWETEFDVIKPKKNKKGNRIFTQKDIESIKMIYHLVREKGYTLQGAKDALKNNNHDTVSRLEVIGKLKEVREFLSEIKRRLDH
ncbi:MerR family transcriptional regulator [Marinigracilibium pacificum]|uniref:MerR family transcriptional regulator n=1 Tax=Marinigracilibium pacificum TaxID=2729599 RepID=A0A848J1L5_9BACT|nr:MerR family transcriptional regulator [Marinigracilibium pacificum]